MKHIDNILYALGQMSVYGEEYLNNRKEILKLEVADRSARILSKLVSRLMIILMSFFLILFASLTFSFVLSGYLESFALGFGSVTLLYLLLIILIVIFRNRLITNTIFRVILKDIMN